MKFSFAFKYAETVAAMCSLIIVLICGACVPARDSFSKNGASDEDHLPAAPSGSLSDVDSHPDSQSEIGAAEDVQSEEDSATAALSLEHLLNDIQPHMDTISPSVEDIANDLRSVETLLSAFSESADSISDNQTANNQVVSNQTVPNQTVNNRQARNARVPYDLEAFRPVLSQSRLHSPATSGNIAVRRGQFRGYELADRFFLGESGTTLVMGTTDGNRSRERSELRHNSNWTFGEGEQRFSARLRFDKPVPLGGQRSRLHFMQIFAMSPRRGPTVLLSWAGSWETRGRDDNLTAFIRGSGHHNLGRRPEGFFDVDLVVRDGRLQIRINNELKVDEDVSHLNGTTAYFKAGTYNRGIRQPQTVEFESLSITTP